MPRVKIHVELLAYTPDPEVTVSLGARVCYSSSTVGDLKSKLQQKDLTKYIENLREMGHLSTFEHAAFTFGIEGISRALLAQITRHRIASFSVQSQRYVVANDSFNYVLPPSIAALGAEAREEFESQMKTMHSWYLHWLEKTGAAEDARFVLPNACETRMLLTMNARELLHFFSLRCCNRAQWEIRTLAWIMLGLCRQAAPSLFAAGGPECLNKTCPEGSKSCGSMKQIKRFSAELDKLLSTEPQKLTEWAIAQFGAEGKENS